MISNYQIDDRMSALAVTPTKSEVGRDQTEPRLLNRDLSLVEFFRQVLEEGLTDRNPLLERLRFLTIFSSIVDEFFMIRISGLKEKVEDGRLEPSADGTTAEEQLREIRSRLRPMMVDQVRGLTQDILPELAAQEIIVAPYSSLSPEERNRANRYYQENVFPVLTPLAVDPAHPFPYISGLSLNLGLMVSAPDDLDPRWVGKDKTRFVRLKVPRMLPGLVRISPSESKYILLSELIMANLEGLFPGMHPHEVHAFRVTRDADIEVRRDEADDLLSALQQGLHQRRFGTPVRLEVAAQMPDQMLDYLTESLGLESDDIYRVDGLINVLDLELLCDLDRPDLKYRPIRTIVPDSLQQEGSIFDAIKRRDILLHHPYTDYSTVTDFIRTAANDPDVLAIKICLYRTGQQSDIAEALVHAGERGKQVTVLIELMARFDEENNIEWARRLEHAGVHVVYGLVGLKTHCKTTLVVRREDHALKRYVHIATGNYNPVASCTYTDLGLLTADEEIGADATEFFNYLTGYSAQHEYRQLLVAPVNLREKVMAMIEREAAHAKAGRPARIVAKLNRLADSYMIQTLYEASQAGVEIDLIVRGICMLRPGVPGLSENITVRSIVGRFLEHSRVFYFANDGSEELYIGSADWMPRNLNRRVEVVVPIKDPSLKTYLKEDLLSAYLRDNVNARELMPDGSYQRVTPTEEVGFDSQMYFEGSFRTV
jgi:polyphosphate kinase